MLEALMNLNSFSLSFHLKLHNLGQNLEDRLWIPNQSDSPIWLSYNSSPASTVLLNVPRLSIVDLIELQGATQEQLVVFHPIPKKTTRILIARGLNNVLYHSRVLRISSY